MAVTASSVASAGDGHQPAHAGHSPQTETRPSLATAWVRPRFLVSSAVPVPSAVRGMELREALSEIAALRATAVAAERFRGYRALPVGATGGLAIVAALVQSRLVAEPATDLTSYLTLWLTTAVVAVTVAGWGVWARLRSNVDPVGRDLTRLAVVQFAPCLVAGMLVTLAVATHAPDAARLLPGLWQVVFSLGLFASYRLLPPAVLWVGVFYLAAGTINLSRSGGGFGPWAMGLPFGFGQLATAAILYWNLERADADPAA